MAGGGDDTRTRSSDPRLVRDSVDFRLARRRIETLNAYSAPVRAHALSAYVGLFDVADEDGFVDLSAEQIAGVFAIARSSWLQYRAVLEEAGLVEVAQRRGGARRGFRLVRP